MHRLCAVAVTLATTVCAQPRTWIVDRNNGAGTNFTNLPPAIAQAGPGDTIIVRAGSYDGDFATSTPMAIVGEGAVTIDATLTSGQSDPMIEIHGIPLGQTFTLRNLTLRSNRYMSLQIRDNAGTVHLHQVTIRVNSQGASPTALSVVRSQYVSVNECDLLGWPAVSGTHSVVAITGTLLQGGDTGSAAIDTKFSSVGLSVTNAYVYLSRTDVHGGPGGFLIPYQSAGVRSLDSTLIVTGDTATVISAGRRGSSSTTPFPTDAITTTGGLVILDPQVQLVPTDGGAPIGGSATVIQREVASLRATGGALGGPFTAELVSPANEPVAILAGLPMPPVPLIGHALFLSPTPLFTLFSGNQAASGRKSVSFLVPNLSALRGVRFSTQAAHYHVARNELELSNPATVVIGQ